MDKLGISLFLLLIFVCPYFLYRNGLLQIKCTRAIGYIGSVGNSYKNYHKATVIGCSGSIRRVLKFKENREYGFILNSDISKGVLNVNILDSNKNIILRLDDKTKQVSITIHQKEKYYLIIKYTKVDGKYELSWR